MGKILLQNFIIICKNFPHLKWGFTLSIVLIYIYIASESEVLLNCSRGWVLSLSFSHFLPTQISIRFSFSLFFFVLINIIKFGIYVHLLAEKKLTWYWDFSTSKFLRKMFIAVQFQILSFTLPRYLCVHESGGLVEIWFPKWLSGKAC